MMITHRAGAIVDEIRDVVARLDEEQLNAVVREITGARRVVVLGVGREGLAARGFAMRLAHLGIDSHWGWDDTTPGVGGGDLLFLVNGSGQIGHLDYVFSRVKEHGARTVVVTGVPEEKTPQQADAVIWVPGSVYGGRGDLVPSSQPMGSLFEQSTGIALDSLILALAEELGKSFAEMSQRHRNFE